MPFTFLHGDQNAWPRQLYFDSWFQRTHDSHHGCEKMEKLVCARDAYTGTLHLQIDRHRKRDLRQGQNMSFLMTNVHQSGSIFHRFYILPKQERRTRVQMHESMRGIPQSVWEITHGEGSWIGSTKPWFPAIWEQEGESSLALQFAACTPDQSPWG